MSPECNPLRRRNSGEVPPGSLGRKYWNEDSTLLRDEILAEFDQLQKAKWKAMMWDFCAKQVAVGDPPPPGIFLIGNRPLTAEEKEYARELEPFARECLERAGKI